jgi:DNA mismatch endonuclease (patch repair protein)
MGMSRSQQMARVKGRHTTPERCLRAALWAKGLRYRLHTRTPSGRPDLVFPGRRVAVFVDGCFWHGCPEHYVRPRTRHAFWAEKLAANVERDRRQTLELEERGWIVLRFWEHEVERDPGLRIVCRRIEEGVRRGARSAVPSWRVQSVECLPLGVDQERRSLIDLRDESLRDVEEGPRYSRSGPRT